MINQDVAVLEINPSRPATACVILLHGLGADGHDLAPLAEAFGTAGRHPVKFMLPHAPYRPVTINDGRVMRAWYDIRGLDLNQSQDEEGIAASAVALLDLVEAQIGAGIPAQRIVIGGFSQGGAVALYAGLGCSRRLGGILALSTYLPLYDRVRQQGVTGDVTTPIMMAHGTHDPVVPPEYGVLSRRRLEALGYSVTWRDYAMGHSLCEQEIGDISAWLNAVFDG